MSGVRVSIRGLLLVALCWALVRKAGHGWIDGALGGRPGTVAALVLEVVVVGLLLGKRDRAAGLLTAALCSGGILLALAMPDKTCACFGAGIDRTEHLMLAGTLGTLAAALLFLADGARRAGGGPRAQSIEEVWRCDESRSF